MVVNRAAIGAVTARAQVRGRVRAIDSDLRDRSGWAKVAQLLEDADRGFALAQTAGEWSEVEQLYGLATSELDGFVEALPLADRGRIERLGAEAVAAIEKVQSRLRGELE